MEIPSDVCWFKITMNAIVLGIINHSAMGVINQISYLGGPHCMYI